MHALETLPRLGTPLAVSVRASAFLTLSAVFLTGLLGG